VVNQKGARSSTAALEFQSVDGCGWSSVTASPCLIWLLVWWLFHKTQPTVSVLCWWRR